MPHPNDNPREQRDQIPAFEKEWITDGLNEKAIEFCESLAKTISPKSTELKKFDALTNSQIRNFYGEVKRLQPRSAKEKNNARLMLQPKLAYASHRKGTKGSKLFNEKLQPALKLAVQEDKYFQNFCDLLEAILSYHKAYDGK